MNIGIIGSGNIGSALARRFGSVGHTVSIANSRGPESLGTLARETSARAVSVAEAASGNDVVVVTIPFKRIEDLPADLFAKVKSDTIVIDTCNYYPQHRDGRIDAVEAGSTESAWVAERVGHAVIKAFNSIYAQHLLENGKPAGTPGRVALAVAGDDARAKDVVMHLVDEIGFDAIDAGTIAESWRQQPGSPGYCKDFDAAGVRRALADANRTRPADFCATPNSPGTYESPA